MRNTCDEKTFIGEHGTAAIDRSMEESGNPCREILLRDWEVDQRVVVRGLENENEIPSRRFIVETMQFRSGVHALDLIAAV